jgi:hypothetical protein
MGARSGREGLGGAATAIHACRQRQATAHHRTPTTCRADRRYRFGVVPNRALLERPLADGSIAVRDGRLALRLAPFALATVLVDFG